jgi:hypothetical protein
MSGLPADSSTAASGVAAEDTAPTGDPLSSAIQRVAESRERLRRQMLQGSSRERARRHVAAARAEGASPSLWMRLRAVPGLGALIDTVSAWWEHHPLHPVAGLAEDMVHDRISPTVRRHPLAVVALALAAGSALAWVRPWRLIVKPALLTGLVSHLATRLVREVPFEAILGAIVAFASSPTHDEAADPVDDMTVSPADASTPTAPVEAAAP